MPLLLLFLSFCGFFFNLTSGFLLGNYILLLNLFCIFAVCYISLLIFFQFLGSSTIIKISVFPWIVSDSLNIEWGFIFDSLTCTMLVVVTFISCLVHLYSCEYMAEDPHLIGFLGYLSLFTFFMLILVTGSNLLQMFVGWEGVGLSSFLLINFWFTRIQANKSAIKAMLVNRVGDFFILLSLFLLFKLYNTLDYDIIFNLSQSTKNFNLSNSYIIQDLICIFLFLGAMGKSAQITLHVWLPDAMEGPTPVSALIHAATMVTAGVFLIARCSFLFETSETALTVITFIGTITAFFASSTGVFQNDIKKIIAYSTCSQLGYMIFSCGLSGYEVALFHLFNHAFFKALLFLGAGSIIHAVNNEQDIRKMGGLKQILPLSYAVSLIGSLALIGFPFLSGFYSKDVILEMASAKGNNLGLFSFILGSTTALFTAFYSTRIILLVFLSKPNGNKTILFNSGESMLAISTPLFILSVLSITIGFFAKDIFIGFGTDFWTSALFISFNNHSMIEREFIPTWIKLIPLIFTITGILIAIIMYIYNIDILFNLKNNKGFRIIYTFFNKKWYFDRIYNQYISQQILSSGHFFSYKNIDRGLLENFGPNQITNSSRTLIKYSEKVENGNLLDQLYIYILIVSILILILSITLNVT